MLCNMKLLELDYCLTLETKEKNIMKKILLILALVPTGACADAPSTSCPDGYITITAGNFTIANTCPDGMVSVGVATACSDGWNNCIMYAPAGVSYTDDGGTYEYTAPCAMK